MSARRPPFTYRVYGLCLKSHWPLACPEGTGPGLAEVELFEGPASLFAEAYREAARRWDEEDWFHYLRLADGSDYLRWSGLFEFVVSADGGRVTCRSLNGPAREAFHTYLLGQVLSFALLKRGIEPLHSTAVVIDREAVGFVADGGYGKSSLAAAFLGAGCPVLTDDLLVVKEAAHGFLAYPGPPRIKLFPHIAQRLLGDRITGIPMNPHTRKLVIPLPADLSSHDPIPLRAIYLLTPAATKPPDKRVRIRTLPPHRACLQLLRHTFNTVVTDAERLKPQFLLAATLASAVPVKLLSYPRSVNVLPSVRDAILSDLAP